MPVPEGTSTLSTPSSSAPLTSLAESVLAQAQASNAPEAASAAPAEVAAKPAAKPAAKVEADDPGADPTDEIAALDATADAAARGESWDEAMRRVPPNVAKLMKRMQADYTRKTQELADQRRELARERESLSKVKFEVPEVGEFDPFDEGSIQKRIQAEVAKKMQELLEPMQQEAELLRAESDYNSFLATNPDFKTDLGLRSEVQALLESNPSLDLQTAYWAAKGKQGRRSTGASDQASDQSRARSKATREAASVVAPPRRGVTVAKPDHKQIRSMSNSDILALAQSMARN